MLPVKTPVLVPVSVSVTSSESPLELVTVTETVSVVVELVFRLMSVTRIHAVLLVAKLLVWIPLLPLVNCVVLGVPKSRKFNVTAVEIELVTPSVPSLAVAVMV